MTAEVAILNKRGVALAADSAVTTGFPDREKIFTTANKIFTLSKVYPVGIMINGHVEHCGIPWEVLIKDFRGRLADRKFDDLRGYVDLFLETVRDQKFLGKNGQAVTVISSGLSALAELQNRMKFAGDEWTVSSIKQTLEWMLNDAKELSSVPGFEGVKFRVFDQTYGSYLEEVARDWGASKLPKACIPLFKNVVFNAMIHQLGGGNYSTGIVIAGYGEANLFPKLYEFTVDGGLLDVVRCYEVGSVDIENEEEGAAISTFAQDDTVQAFIKGLNEKFQIFHLGMVSHMMQLVTDELLREHTQMTGDERQVASAMISKRVSEAMVDFRQETDDFAEEEFRTPVLEVLRAAPKETLAELAESLVSITSLRQRVSGELETVGGPVDVALISKGEGFIWIKRKHYFDRELNPHYTRNYFREVSHGQAS